MRPRRPATWAVVALVLACGLMVAGIALPHLGEPVVAPVPTGTAPPVGATGLVEGPVPGETPTDVGQTVEPWERSPWSVGLFKLGFSFAAAFAIGYAARAFLKFTLVALGFFVVALLGLQYAGLIEIRWVAVEGAYDNFSAWFQRQVESFEQFVAGALPSSASAAVGLIAGMRRR